MERRRWWLVVHGADGLRCHTYPGLRHASRCQCPDGDHGDTGHEPDCRLLDGQHRIRADGLQGLPRHNAQSHDADRGARPGRHNDVHRHDADQRHDVLLPRHRCLRERRVCRLARRSRADGCHHTDRGEPQRGAAVGPARRGSHTVGRRQLHASGHGHRRAHARTADRPAPRDGGVRRGLGHVVIGLHLHDCRQRRRHVDRRDRACRAGAQRGDDQGHGECRRQRDQHAARARLEHVAVDCPRLHCPR